MAAIEGTCASMCPAAEVAQRTAAGTLHPCEGGGRPLVKSYSRSAAGEQVSPPSALRPESVLTATVAYLLADVLPHFTLGESYWFIADRLRAVRKDARQQEIHTLGVLSALRSMARFHAGAAYLCCGVMNDGSSGGGGGGGGSYNPVLNDAMLVDTISHAAQVTAALLVVPSPSSSPSSSSSPASASAHARGAAAARSVFSELLALKLSLAMADAAETTALLRTYSRAPWRGAAGDDRRALLSTDPLLRSVAALAAAWRSGQWGAFLQQAAALGDVAGSRPGAGAVDDKAAGGRIAVRCIIHRYLPLARARLLRDWATAVPSRLSVPVELMATLFDGQESAAGATKPAGTPSTAGRAADTSDAASAAAWQQDRVWLSSMCAAARFLLQLGQSVTAPSATLADPTGGSAAATTAPLLDAPTLLRAEAAALEPCVDASDMANVASAAAAAQDWYVRFAAEAIAVLPTPGGTAAAAGNLKQQIAMTPSRSVHDDAFVLREASPEAFLCGLVAV